MSQMLHKPMTPEEFLAWEETQEGRWEFNGFEPVAMTGGTIAHAVIQGNIITALNNRLRGKLCRPYGPDLKLQVGSSYRYPDVVVSCTKQPPDATIVIAPVISFEVLSKSTERNDRSVKLLEYRSLSSIQRYILVEQDQALLTDYRRVGEIWTLDQLNDRRTLTMPEIGIEVPVSEFYADVELPDPGSLGSR